MEKPVRKQTIKHTLIGAVVTLSLSTLLTGCNKAISEPAEPLIKPVKLLAVKDLTVDDSDAFLARIDATYRAQLSFQVGGEVEKLLVRMGQGVEKGEVLATLDPKDLQLALDAAQAEYALAKTQWERAKSLYSKKLISTDSYDQKETQYKAALASFEQAKTDLSYTKIQAPFDGVVSYTYVKPYQVVGEKQEILNLIDNTTLDVSFTLPVSYAESVSLSALKNAEMWVTMDSEPSKRIPGKFKEISTQPNIDTNSYEAIVTITRPTDRNLLTGMTGQVHIAKQNKSNAMTLPTSAWVNKQESQGEVWVMDSSTQQVSKVTLSLNESGAIESGLDNNDYVVIAGVERLVEGQVVKAWIREEGI
ncbi:TPA: multidrug efflux RND transporter periplasmic adaptor subunit VmeT [Vibrio parahaemolyticus]|uniref:multidrug efflux RND transporter periplasmic adaptor subunit VmeT n=1 Tax=Vibrio parahaemolyticus TaxID=670 RepID=UPI0003F77C52|nr:multidrug efflux RND transporter periplasmic adaptor subunit VmeT [Vibrio parahaemolyticus]EGR1171877.1 multidrug efflux RND transporter periplasmic adaptor subunit VmeT [Vibrio parahaemolyticus]EJG0224680.1 multidrug efflux RND transporter periplasmic adaptor subunit VmeT [Vibrio parahaemolyticus]EJG0323469.1 multidrug efflux RND transporter periplasmic adaptor subunit VmeT [Vibrio parahaemolyticus]EJG0348903.1 multidrug efflux RND transporter periplasmic adaptor subunit VmeT [Vibrio paraha